MRANPQEATEISPIMKSEVKNSDANEVQVVPLAQD